MELAVSITFDAEGTVPMAERLADERVERVEPRDAMSRSEQIFTVGAFESFNPYSRLQNIAPTMRALLRAAPMLKRCDLAPIMCLRMGGPEWCQHCGMDETHPPLFRNAFRPRHF